MLLCLTRVRSDMLPVREEGYPNGRINTLSSHDLSACWSSCKLTDSRGKKTECGNIETVLVYVFLNVTLTRWVRENTWVAPKQRAKNYALTLDMLVFVTEKPLWVIWEFQVISLQCSVWHMVNTADWACLLERTGKLFSMIRAICCFCFEIGFYKLLCGPCMYIQNISTEVVSHDAMLCGGSFMPRRLSRW